PAAESHGMQKKAFLTPNCLSTCPKKRILLTFLGRTIHPQRRMKTPFMVQSNVRFLRIASAVLLLLGSVFFGKETFAAVAKFNFEALDTTSGGALSSLTLTSGTVTMMLTRNQGVHFDITDLSFADGPPSWGMRSLDPNQIGSYDPGLEFIADFAAPICTFRIEFGDYDADEDTLVLNAWSGPGGTGTLLDSASVVWSADKTFPDQVGVGKVSGSTGSIRSVTFVSTGLYNNSVYYDNITVATHSTDRLPPVQSNGGIQLRWPSQSTAWQITPSGVLANPRPPADH